MAYHIIVYILYFLLIFQVIGCDIYLTMASRDKQFHHYVQSLEAVQLVCDEAVIPCVENITKDWHSKKQVYLYSTNRHVTLKHCTSQSQNPNCMSKRVTCNKRRNGPQDSPIYPFPCQNCIQWCHAIELVSFPRGVPITWSNIIPHNVSHDPLEFAKAFAVILPPGQNPTCFRDFDPSCLLKIMMRFGVCHRNTQADHDIIKEVMISS